jgi:hypothetical protein
MTRLELRKAMKADSVLTKFQKNQLNDFLLKSLTWGVCHKVANVGVRDAVARKKLYKPILARRKNPLYLVRPKKLIRC